ncbi:unnamed protein product [Caenorhabditis auriculariae]|uniref:Uncharacterized protein n=1 Tax=Caenorhabditis auriculariae TaxID=2777116 RepID=A0A8S1H7V6_9PELO|nr:unnamed protein product [Caenorhabditis auriculariae]
MVAASLLHSEESDDDVPDLDLPGSTRRRQFFNKSSSSARSVQDLLSERRRPNCVKMAAFLALAVAICLVYTVYKTYGELDLLRRQLREAQAEASGWKKLEQEVRRVTMQFDLVREAANETTRPVTDYVYDRLANLSAAVDVAVHDLRKTTGAVDDVMHRMSRVESKCLAVCQDAGGEASRSSREQPRRRQAEKKTSRVAVGDDVVFKRNEP